MFSAFSKNFQPQLFTVLKEGYTLKQFSSDLIAGIIVGIVALPLAIAFGMASGVTAQQGLYTAIIAGFIISFFSGSRVQIGGPTGAFIVIVYGVVQSQGLQGLMLATIIAGVILIVMGLCGLGTLIKFIPYPVTLGFTSGIAVIIAASQIPQLCGFVLGNEKIPAEFIDKIVFFFNHWHSTNYWAVALSAAAVAVIFLTPRFTGRVPGSLIAVIVCTLAVYCFRIPVDTIGQTVGQQPVPLEFGLPRFAMPVSDWQSVMPNLSNIFSAAVAIAMLGAIESLLSAVVADGMTSMTHKSNTELVAQGIANVVTPFYGGIPATGAIARTATNVRNGGRTPIAGLIHAVTLLLIVLFFGKYAAMIPLAALAGILITVSINMSDYRMFWRQICSAPKSDITVMLITFLLTVFLDLTIAIPVGLILASFLFMSRMEKLFGAGLADNRLHIFDDDPHEDPMALRLFDVPEDVHVYEVNGPFFFGAAGKFQSAMSGSPCRVLILRMRNVPVMDATGVNAIEELLRRAEKAKTTVLISGIQPQPHAVMRRYGLFDKIPADNIHATIVEALPHAADIVEAQIREEKKNRSPILRKDCENA
ncbi:MAG: STAS domain-containing protein [Planctomycetaceae bacterium]|jgi:SulP family sulfate permease|nr:STAS domain-containing protein [Planctomycetaceae bacterium]